MADESIFNYYTGIGTDVVNDLEEFNGNNGMLLYGHYDRHNNYTDPKTWTVVLAHHHGTIKSND